MTPLRRVLAGCAMACCAAAAQAQGPVYLQRLGLPVAADAILAPEGVTADLHTGEIFVCDSRANRILVFDGEGLYRHEIVGGTAFSAPHDVAVDPRGLLLVLAASADGFRVHELDFDGLPLRILELTGVREGMQRPGVTSLALSPDGERLFLTDSTNLRLWWADRDGRLLGSVDLADGLTEAQRTDFRLGKVDVYGEQVLQAVPSEGQIWLFGLDGALRGQLGSRGTGRCQLAAPNAAALDEAGNLLVLDQQKMVLSIWDAGRNECISEHLGIGAAPGALYFPVDLALDAAGRAYLAQGFEGRVQVYGEMVPAAQPPGGGPAPVPADR